MPTPKVQFIDVGGKAIGQGKATARRRLALLHQPAVPGLSRAKQQRPGIFWLQGFKSTMISLKASALADWAAPRGLAFTRFDYCGHGQSSGRFADCTIGEWLQDARAVFNGITSGPQILVGSSMGGWLALLLLRDALLAESKGMAGNGDMASRIKGLVLIAPAWDMTEELMWKAAPPDVREELIRSGRYLRPSAYDDGPYEITMKLITEGRKHLIKDQPFDPQRPISIIHGRLDPDVPFAHSVKLRQLLPGDHVKITAVADGEHRLSRPQDLKLLCEMIEAMLEAV